MTTGIATADPAANCVSSAWPQVLKYGFPERISRNCVHTGQRQFASSAWCGQQHAACDAIASSGRRKDCAARTHAPAAARTRHHLARTTDRSVHLVPTLARVYSASRMPVKMTRRRTAKNASDWTAL